MSYIQSGELLKMVFSYTLDIDSNQKIHKERPLSRPVRKPVFLKEADKKNVTLVTIFLNLRQHSLCTPMMQLYEYWDEHYTIYSVYIYKLKEKAGRKMLYKKNLSVVSFMLEIKRRL